ncbi:hypothetical protein [Meiothermus ruber]|uniref:Uncharacterized protein n=1 Tax=Meiothermus ruber (strain ATCC 35948 / DSM 1279 / VKM B-1258 / 21) TaxID=504728 RepID=D3PTE9_MEIRD|nr:hypothetical protein [Meiothermus ruber]ADD28732.1 hypothetical protein Mrub_1976 [Meiothermus ruber DSM 1279]AGK05820.1 hypothetical protein K649_12670 [Meiothermus ruber DSM 1279]
MAALRYLAAALLLSGLGWLIATAYTEFKRLEGEVAQLKARRPAQISLDLTPAAMETCKRLFVRYTQGGHVDEYRCELKNGAIVLMGPNWQKAQGDRAPIEELGREELN